MAASRSPAGIEALIADYITGELLRDGSTLDPDENLFTAGYVDSVGIMRLIAHVESTLEVQIPPTDLVPENFRTVRVMAAYLAGRTAGADAAAPAGHRA